MEKALLFSALLAFAMPASAALPCGLTQSDVTALGKLLHPISVASDGKMTKDGTTALTDDEVGDVCASRAFYRLVLDKGTSMTLDDVASNYYIPSYLLSPSRGTELPKLKTVVSCVLAGNAPVPNNKFSCKAS